MSYCFATELVKIESHRLQYYLIYFTWLLKNVSLGISQLQIIRCNAFKSIDKLMESLREFSVVKSTVRRV